ncbi:coiled-coil domain-containing protein [Halomonas sp. MS1]|nr:hypothetical protein [Halomonas sp. MS1]UTD55544.1 hypothetical protein NF683_20780 [Halomonas sp. MS1]
MPRVIYLGLQAFAHEPHQLLPAAENPLACESLVDISEADTQAPSSIYLLSTLNDEDVVKLRAWCKHDAERQVMIAWPQPDAWLAASLASGAVAEEALNDWLAQAKRLLALFRSARRQITLVGYSPGRTSKLIDAPLDLQTTATDKAIYQLAAAYLCGQAQPLQDTYAYLLASSQESPVEEGHEATIAQAALNEYHALQATSEKGLRDGRALQQAESLQEQQQQNIARLKGELTAAREEYAVVFQQLQSVQSSLAESVDKQKANVEQHEQESAKRLEELQQQTKALQKENAQLSQDNATIKKAQLALQQEKESLKKALAAQLNTQKEGQETLATAQKESAQLLSTLQQAQQAYETLNQEYQALAERKENQIAEQQRLVNAQQQNMDSVVTKLERRAAEVQKIQQQLEKSTQDTAHFRQQLEKRQKELNILRADTQRHISHLERLVQWLRVHAQRHAAVAYRDSRSYKKELPKQLAMLEATPFFDADWYLAQYPDVAKSGIKPAEHFIKFGAIDGRHPSPQFSTDFYLTHYKDVAASGQHPLLHYLRHGIAEQRKTQPPQHHLPAPKKPTEGADA